jgi:hypothetical protein
VLAGAITGVLLAQPLQDREFQSLAMDDDAAQLTLSDDVQPGAALQQMLSSLAAYSADADNFVQSGGVAADNLLLAIPAGCIWQKTSQLKQRLSAGQMTPAGAAAACLVALSYNEKAPPQVYLREVLSLVDGQSSALERALLRVGHVLGWGSETHALRHLAQNNALHESVPLAIYCLLRYPVHPQQALKRAVYSPGHRVQTAGLVGAMCGASHGAALFPARARALLKTYLPDADE